jgi:Flp pilus assembly pilin Flp
MLRLHRSSPRFVNDARGAAAVEFSFVFPLLLLLLAGGYEVGAALQAKQSVQRLATQTALVVADCANPTPGACAAEPKVIASAVQKLAPALDGVHFTLGSAEFRREGAQVVAVHLSDLALDDFAATVRDRFRDGQSGVVIRARYQHRPLVFPDFLQQLLGSAMTFEVYAYSLKS